MPAANSPESSRGASRVRRANAVRASRRHREQQTRESDRNVRSHGDQLLDTRTPLPVIDQGELGSANTLSALTRHRLTRQRDHDPLGATVQQAMDQLGEQTEMLSARLRDPLPDVPDDARDGEDGPPRRKRRKRDHDPLSGRDIPQYGHYGRVVPGLLQMEITSCDGGTFRDPVSVDHKVENILLDDESTYCSTNPKCNILLNHRGGTPFALTSITIRHPAQGFTSRLQEGLVFVSMSADDLQFRTERYDLVKNPDASTMSNSIIDSPAEVARQGSISTQRHLLRELGRRGGQTPPPRLSSDLFRYRAVTVGNGLPDLPHTFPAARAVRTRTQEEMQADLSELISRNTALLEQSAAHQRHNSWQQPGTASSPARVSTATQTTSPPPDRSTSPDSPFTPAFQDFDVTVTSEWNSSGDSNEDTAMLATMRGYAEDRQRRAAIMPGRDTRRLRMTTREDDGVFVSVPPGGTGPYSDWPPGESPVQAEWSASEEDGPQWARPRQQIPGTLPSMRMEPDDEHPMYDSGRHIRRPGRRPSQRYNMPRKVEWVPNKIKRADLNKGASGDDILKPHAHFFIKNSKDSVTLEFEPAV